MKTFKYIFYTVMAVVMTGVMSSCDDEERTDTPLGPVKMSDVKFSNYKTTDGNVYSCTMTAKLDFNGASGTPTVKINNTEFAGVATSQNGVYSFQLTDIRASYKNGSSYTNTSCQAELSVGSCTCSFSIQNPNAHQLGVLDDDVIYYADSTYNNVVYGWSRGEDNMSIYVGFNTYISHSSNCYSYNTVKSYVTTLYFKLKEAKELSFDYQMPYSGSKMSVILDGKDNLNCASNTMELTKYSKKLSAGTHTLKFRFQSPMGNYSNSSFSAIIRNFKLGDTVCYPYNFQY